MAGTDLGLARLSASVRLSPVRSRQLDGSRAWYPAGIALLVGVYYGVAHIGYALRFAGPVGSLVWLPVGVGISFLFVFGFRFWPGVVVGDLLVNNYSAIPFGAALGQTFGNLLEVLVAVALMRAASGRRPLQATINGFAAMVGAIAAGTAVSATMGSISLRLSGVIAGGAAPAVWRTWWLGDFCGALLVVSLVLAWSRPLDETISVRRRLETAATLAVVVGLCEIAFWSGRNLAYIVFPALIWSAVRLDRRAVAAAVGIAAGFAVWATTHYTGPFYAHSLERSVLQMQLFIAVASVSTLCLAAAVAERKRLADRLWASRARLVHAADSERRRLEHNLHDGAQQRLAALMVRLDLGAEQARRPPLEREALFEAAKSELASAISELRELAHGGQPRVLAEQGLGEAINDLAERSIVPVDLIEVPQTRLPANIEAAAYFVISEAVMNVQKHARASRLRLAASSRRGAIHLEVADDGVGGAFEGPGSGLQGLRDRVEALGGTLDIHSRPGRGTRVTATIPVARHTRSGDDTRFP